MQDRQLNVLVNCHCIFLKCTPKNCPLCHAVELISEAVVNSTCEINYNL